jgi:CBS domain-containing protein
MTNRNRVTSHFEQITVPDVALGRSMPHQYSYMLVSYMLNHITCVLLHASLEAALKISSIQGKAGLPLMLLLHLSWFSDMHRVFVRNANL